MYSLNNAKFNVSCINMVTMVHVNITSNQNLVNQNLMQEKKPIDTDRIYCFGEGENQKKQIVTIY